MKLRLRRQWYFILGVVFALIMQLLASTFIERYSNYLHECDARTGYTCNVFGQ